MRGVGEHVDRLHVIEVVAGGNEPSRVVGEGRRMAGDVHQHPWGQVEDTADRATGQPATWRIYDRHVRGRERVPLLTDHPPDVAGQDAVAGHPVGGGVAGGVGGRLRDDLDPDHLGGVAGYGDPDAPDPAKQVVDRLGAVEPGRLGDPRIQVPGHLGVGLKEALRRELETHAQDLFDDPVAPPEYAGRQTLGHLRYAIVDGMQQADQLRVGGPHRVHQLIDDLLGARRGDHRHEQLTRGDPLPDDNVPQSPMLRALVVRDDLVRERPGADRLARGVAQRARQQARIDVNDLVPAAAAMEPQMQVPVGSGRSRVLHLVAVAELGDRRIDGSDLDTIEMADPLEVIDNVLALSAQRRRIGDVLQPAPAARAHVRARRGYPVGARLEHLDQIRLGEAAARLADPHPGTIARRGVGDKHDEPVQPADPEAAEGECVDAQVELVVALRSGHGGSMIAVPMPPTPTARWTFLEAATDAGPAHRNGLAVVAGRIAATPARRARRITLPDGWQVSPGFWDLQVNGAGGAEIGDDPEEIAQVAVALPAFGVTAFCPTLITRRPAAYRRAAAAMTAVRWPRLGARSLGVHLEGPFLARERRGAHPASAIATPDPATLAGLLAAFGPRIMTVAPECPGGIHTIAALHKAGVIPAVGHTAADAATCRAAIDAGARLLTHALNAMPGVAAREPGPLGAFIAAPGTFVALIADGVHVDPAVVALVAAAAGRRLIAISDAVAAAGAGPGDFLLSGRRIRSDGARVTDAQGHLAGSARGLDAAPGLLQAAGRTPAAALAAVTTAPRRILGSVRPLVPGAPADLVVLDADLVPRITLIGGEVAWQDPASPLDLS